MIIFLYGSDTYRSRQKLTEIIEQYKKTHKTGLNLGCFNLLKESFQDFKGVFKIKSMFKEKKLLVLENASSNKNFKEEFLAEEKSSAKIWSKTQDVILFYEPKALAKEKFFNFLKNNAKCQEFKPLKGQNLKNWARKEFEKLDTEITERALEKLIDFVDNDLWRFVNEIKKLTAFKNGKTVKIKDVELLVKPKVVSDIFKTIDAISQKNKKKGLSLIKKHLKIGDNPLYLLTMINYQFRNLLIIKDLIDRGKNYWEILKSVGLHPYVVKKSYLQAERFTLLKLKEIYKLIFQIDYKIKTGKIDPETGLVLLISKI